MTFRSVAGVAAVNNKQLTKQNPENIILERPNYFHRFSIVIAAGLCESVSKSLAKELWHTNIPLILVRSVGFIGSFRIIISEHTSTSSLSLN